MSAFSIVEKSEAMVDDGVAGESACSSSRLLRRITVNAFARLKRATLQCRVPKCALHSDDLGVFVVSQKKERVFSKNLFVWLNRDLAVNPGGDIRIVISPGLGRFQRFKLGNHR